MKLYICKGLKGCPRKIGSECEFRLNTLKYIKEIRHTDCKIKLEEIQANLK